MEIYGWGRTHPTLPHPTPPHHPIPHQRIHFGAHFWDHQGCSCGQSLRNRIFKKSANLEDDALPIGYFLSLSSLLCVFVVARIFWVDVCVCVSFLWISVYFLIFMRNRNFHWFCVISVISEAFCVRSWFSKQFQQI